MFFTIVIHFFYCYQDSQKIQLCAGVHLRYADNITLFIEVCGRIYFMLKFMVAELHKVLILHSLFVPVTAQFCHKFSYKRPVLCMDMVANWAGLLKRTSAQDYYFLYQ
jgi:hypothetical protein